MCKSNTPAVDVEFGAGSGSEKKILAFLYLQMCLEIFQLVAVSWNQFSLAWI
jgi:hypothetical protein